MVYACGVPHARARHAASSMLRGKGMVLCAACCQAVACVANAQCVQCVLHVARNGKNQGEGRTKPCVQHKQHPNLGERSNRTCRSAKPAAKSQAMWQGKGYGGRQTTCSPYPHHHAVWQAQSVQVCARRVGKVRIVGGWGLSFICCFKCWRSHNMW